MTRIDRTPRSRDDRRTRRGACPILAIHGTDDPHTSAGEIQEWFDRVRTDKEVWWLTGARHEDLYAFADQEYERRVLTFFARYLKQTQ